MKKKIISLLLLFVLMIMPFQTATFAVADGEEGKVIVHFYNADNEYSYKEWSGKPNIEWGAYYWVDSGKTVASGEDGVQEKDPEFAYDDGKVLNSGIVFRIQLNASETEAVRKGKKLGLIMVRSYRDSGGKMMPYWCGNTGKDLSSDRYLSVKFDSKNEFHVWIIAGDKKNYSSLDEAKHIFERVQSAKFDDFDTLQLKCTKPITKDTVIQLYKDDDLTDGKEGELYKDGLHATELSADGTIATIKGLGMQDFDWSADYSVLISDVSDIKASCIKTRLYLSDKFQSECIPSSDVQLGAIYSASSTTFRLWAPVSNCVKVNFYKTGSTLDEEIYMPAVAMKRGAKGVWEVQVEGDLNGVYYTYSNYVDGGINEVNDIYAQAVGINGDRAMVCDMATTNPEGWENDLLKAQTIRENSDAAVIWEIHVRDFSIAADSGITHKGKYLAFTEDGTHVKGEENIKTGISYLKDLGITYVHLNPVFDFATVDEGYVDSTSYASKQNWGYDPKNYNVPDGSYATDPNNGEVRINEFKQMVQALHSAGIGVIMDVVYNHTYVSDSWFEQTVPGYYYRQALADGMGSFNHRAWRTDSLGQYSFSDGSGCSNETASERAMFRKYMIDSVVYWVNEYHVDGFRFDLMAIHDVETMNLLREALDTKTPSGRNIMVYGEPWAAASLGLEDGQPADSNHLNQLDSRIAAFNDRMREGVKGGNGPSTGYVQGNVSYMLDRVKAGINGLFLSYDGSGVVSSESSHTITYTTSHDNYTLWDQLVHTTVGDKSPTVYSEYNSVVEKKNMLAATLILTSKGRSFILAGEEIARTKFGNHNSYNAQDKINAFDYNRQEDFGKLYGWYKGLIELRTKRFTSIVKGDNAEVYDDFGRLYYTYNRATGTNDEYSKIMVLVNPYGDSWQAPVSGNWLVIADGKSFNFSGFKTVSSIEVPAYTSIILAQK